MKQIFLGFDALGELVAGQKGCSIKAKIDVSRLETGKIFSLIINEKPATVVLRENGVLSFRSLNQVFIKDNQVPDGAVILDDATAEELIRDYFSKKVEHEKEVARIKNTVSSLKAMGGKYANIAAHVAATKRKVTQ